MAINLVSLVSQFLTPQLVGGLARALGINEAVAQKLVAAAVPAIVASLGTAAAAPGGAQKVSDAVSNSDPDILSKLSGAISGGNTRFMNEGGTLLSGLLGGGGLSSLTGALSQFSGAPQPATQALLGTVTHATVGTIGQQDPSNWSDPSAILSMLNSQKSAISAALPPELSRALGASGLLAGLGGMATAAAQGATSTVSSAASAASSTASSAASSAARSAEAAARSAQSAAARVPAAAASSSSGFPMWAIILIVVVALLAIWWFMTQHEKPAEPAKTGQLAPIEFALRATPVPTALQLD
ncbi:MAG: DUF937 domain-containing protein [Roseiarcus sp.]